MTPKPQASKTIDEINKYNVPKWLIEALKPYDSIMTDEVRRRDTIKTMTSKRKLAKAITQAMLDALPEKLSMKPAIQTHSDAGAGNVIGFNEAIDQMESAIKLRGEK